MEAVTYPVAYTKYALIHLAFRKITRNLSIPRRTAEVWEQKKLILHLLSINRLSSIYGKWCKLFSIDFLRKLTNCRCSKKSTETETVPTCILVVYQVFAWTGRWCGTFAITFCTRDPWFFQVPLRVHAAREQTKYIPLLPIGRFTRELLSLQRSRRRKSKLIRTRSGALSCVLRT